MDPQKKEIFSSMLRESLDKIETRVASREEIARALRETLKRLQEESFRDEEYFTSEDEEEKGESNYLGTPPDPRPVEHLYPGGSEELRSLVSSIPCLVDVPSCRPVAAFRSNDLSLREAVGGSAELFNPFRLQGISMLPESKAGRSANRSNPGRGRAKWNDQRRSSPPGRDEVDWSARSSRSPLSGRGRTEWNDRRNRSPPGCDGAERDDREVPNPEYERDLDEGEGSEDESRRLSFPPAIIAKAAASNYDRENSLNYSQLNNSLYGPRGSTMGLEGLGTTALPSAVTLPSLYAGSMLTGVPGIPIAVSPYADGQQNQLLASETVARVLAASREPRKPRGEKRPIPNEQKDDRYYERRKKNNEAAKKSRDARKKKESEVYTRVTLLETENAYLRKQLTFLKTQIDCMLIDPVVKGLPLVSMLNLAGQSTLNFNALLEHIKTFRESMSAEEKLKD